MHRTATIETTLTSEIPNLINEKNVIIGQGKSPVSILADEFCEEQAFPNLLAKIKFDFSVPRDIPASPGRSFNQRLLNFHQHFESDASYIFLSKFVYVCMSSITYVHK